MGLDLNNTRYVACGEGTSVLAYSDDLITWTSISPSPFQRGRCVLWTGRRWLAGGSKGSGNSSLVYSDDGETWIDVSNANNLAQGSSSVFSTVVNKIASNGSTIVAVGKGGTTSSQAITVQVLVTYTPPAELIAQLTTGTWRIAAEEYEHMGVGPNEAPDPWWWQAPAYAKASSGLYDDRYTFNPDGTFTFSAGADSELFGKVIPLERDFGGDRGQTSVANNEHENYPVTQDDVDKISGTWYISAPGGVETLNFTGLGHVGFYIGSHSLEIFLTAACLLVVA